MNTPDIALAALIIACIAMVGSLISDTILLYEYSAYLDYKDRVKSLLSTKADMKVMRQVVEMMAQKMAEQDAQDSGTNSGTDTTLA